VSLPLPSWLVSSPPTAPETTAVPTSQPRRGAGAASSPPVAEGVAGASVLDIGGGVGVLHHELLQVGAASATGVDGSAAYIDAAMEEAQMQGHAGRVGYHHGDFVAVAKDIEPAEVVTLDKVICCYHDVEGLVGLSSRRATRL